MLALEKSSYELVLGESDYDVDVCFAAYLAHSPIRSRKGFFYGEVLDEEDTFKVLKGLAKVSLENSDFEYRGLSQPAADIILGELFGDVAEFFRPILS